MRILRPAEGIYAFYDGRIEGYQALEKEGVRRFTVVLSHWHLDDVAGTAAFRDSEVIASDRTAELLARFGPAIERGEHEGPPGIDPLILPTRVFGDRLQLAIGQQQVELVHTNIHSDDATVLWLPGQRLLLCGDTMEDTITYVDEPQSFGVHLANLERLRQLDPARILPNHGDPDVIGGGYSKDLIRATEHEPAGADRGVVGGRSDPLLRAVRGGPSGERRNSARLWVEASGPPAAAHYGAASR